MRWKLRGLLAMLVAAAAFVVVPLATADHEAVTICHRTGSDTNPFVVITTDNHSIIAAHIGVPGNPPHPPKGGRADFVLPFPGGTVDDCKKGDPDPPK